MGWNPGLISLGTGSNSTNWPEKRIEPERVELRVLSNLRGRRRNGEISRRVFEIVPRSQIDIADLAEFLMAEVHWKLSSDGVTQVMHSLCPIADEPNVGGKYLKEKHH